MRLYSRAGEHGVLWHLVADLGLLLDPRRRDDYLHAIRAVLVAYALNTAIKYVVRRPRPYLGVHYPSDIAAGAALGVAVAELAP